MPYRKFTKEIGLIGITNLAMALRGILLLPIITKFLGVTQYGIWAQLVVITSLVTPIINLGLPYALVRFLPGEKNKAEIQDGIYSVVTLLFILGLIVSLGFFLLAGPISSFLQCESILVQILALAILFESLNQVFLNVFRAFREIKKYSFFIIFQGLGEVALIILFIILGYGLFGAVLALLAIRVINFLITGAIVIRKVGIKFPTFSRIKEYIHFSLPTVPGNISNWFVHFNDRFLIGYFLGAFFVGYYVPVYTLGAIVAFFESPLSFLLPSVLSKLYDENKINEVKNYLRYSLKYLLMITIPAFFGLSVLAKQLLTILSTSQIAENGYLLVPFMALSMLFYGAYGVIPQILVLVKKTSILGKIWVIATFLNLVLNIILIPYFGILAAALNTLLTYLFIFATSCYYSFKYLRFKIEWNSIQKSILASLVMSVSIVLINPAGILKVLSAILSGAIIYGILLFLLGAIDKKEIEFFKSFLKKGG